MMTMRKRFTTTARRARYAGLLTAGMAVGAALVAVDAAEAQPRSLPLDQAQPMAEPSPLAPAQRDQLFPAQRGGVSLAQATSMAQGRYQGRVVRAETVQMGDRTVHEIRILGDDGRVRTVRIDAQTGSFL
jgi:uncharacterized membrane protein YkoI